MPEEQLLLGNVGAVPDLLRQQTAVAGECLERLCQFLGRARASGRQLSARTFCRAVYTDILHFHARGLAIDGQGRT